MHLANIRDTVFKHRENADDEHDDDCPGCEEADSRDEGPYPDDEFG